MELLLMELLRRRGHNAKLRAGSFQKSFLTDFDQSFWPREATEVARIRTNLGADLLESPFAQRARDRLSASRLSLFSKKIIERRLKQPHLQSDLGNAPASSLAILRESPC